MADYIVQILKTFPCDSGVAIKDIVYIDGSNTWQKAKADSIITTYAKGIVLSKPSSTTAVILIKGTYKDFGTGLTSGTKYYLSITTAGSFTTTPPSENNDEDKFIVLLGTAVNATDIDFDIKEPIEIL